jgi:hypothetical protein
MNLAEQLQAASSSGLSLGWLIFIIVLVVLAIFGLIYIFRGRWRR